MCGVEGINATAMCVLHFMHSFLCSHRKTTAPQCVGFLILFTHSMYNVHVCVYIIKMLVVLRTIRSCGIARLFTLDFQSVHWLVELLVAAAAV